MTDTEHVTPFPELSTEIKFTLNQDSIVDAHISSQVLPIEAQIKQLYVEKDENQSLIIAHNDAQRGLFTKLEKEHAAEVEKLALPLYGPFLNTGCRLYVECSISVSYSGRKPEAQKPEYTLSVSIFEINTNTDTTDEDFDPGNYECFSENQRSVPAGENIQTVIEELYKFRTRDLVIGNQIAALQQQIKKIRDSRQTLLGQLNLKLLEESPHGKVIASMLSANTQKLLNPTEV